LKYLELERKSQNPKPVLEVPYEEKGEEQTIDLLGVKSVGIQKEK